MSLLDIFLARTDPHDASAEARAYRGRPILSYEVESHAGRGEVRRYVPHLFAAVTVTGPQDEAFEKGFATLTDYVSGANADEMVLPAVLPASQILVGHRRGCDTVREWRIALPMPLDRLADGTAPAPEDPDVMLRRARFERIATWRLDPDELADPSRAEGMLETWLKGQGLEPAGELRLLFHDDPLTPPDRRRTEIALPV